MDMCIYIYIYIYIYAFIKCLLYLERIGIQKAWEILTL